MKFKTVLIFGLLALMLPTVNAQTRGIAWQNYPNWNSVIENAKKERLPIFLDLYATWCGPCKWMDKEVYANDSVGEFFNKEFIRVKVQLDSLQWDDPMIKSWYASALELKNAYSVRSFPTIIFLSPDGEIYQKIEGTKDSESLMREARQVLKPENQYSSSLKKYELGNREPFFVRELVRKAHSLGDKLVARKMAQEYIKSLKDDEMLKPDNIWFIYENTKTSRDRGFGFLFKYADTIAKIDPNMGVKYSQSKIVMIVDAEAIRPFMKEDNGNPDWKSIDDNIRRYGKAGEMVRNWFKPKWIFKAEMIPFLEKNPSWESLQKKIDGLKLDSKGILSIYENTVNHYKYMYLKKIIPDNKTLVKVVDYYLKHPDTDLGNGNLPNDFAWMAFNKFDDEHGLKVALTWSRLAMGCTLLDGASLDTFANLLYKLGRKDDALLHEGLAVQKAPDDEEIQSNYLKMKAGQATWTKNK